MKKLSNFILEANLDIQDGGCNFISAEALEQYLATCSKFLSPEAKVIIQYLIDNNSTYIQDMSNGKAGNALELFYNAGVPKDATKKVIYKAIGTLAKKGRLLEVPVFQSEDTFDNLLDKKISLDEVVLDLDSEKGRNAVAKKFDPLVWKIARSYEGKSNFSLEELYAYGLEGLTRAMNKYGKKTENTIADEEAVKSTTFFTFAGCHIRSHILDMIVAQSHLVSIPKNQQRKEKELTGRNTKNYSVSGDQTMGHDSDGNAKSMFDYMDGDAGTDQAGRGIDMEDIQKNWDLIYSEIEKKFDEKTLDIWYSLYGVRGHEKVKNKELMQKYGMGASKVTYYATKVNQYILNTPKLKNAILDIRELMADAD